MFNVVIVDPTAIFSGIVMSRREGWNAKALNRHGLRMALDLTVLLRPPPSVACIVSVYSLSRLKLLVIVRTPVWGLIANLSTPDPPISE